MKRFLLLFAIVLSISNITNGQNFKRSYSMPYLNPNSGYAIQTPDGGYLAVFDGIDSSEVFFNIMNKYLIKTDFKGDTIWIKKIRTEFSDRVRSIISTEDNGFILATMGFVNLIKIDGYGKEVWGKGLLNSWTINEIIKNKDGTYAIVGDFTGPDIRLGKINATGDTLWTRIYRGRELYESAGLSVIQTPDDGFVIVGTERNKDNSTLVVIKTDKNGGLEWKRKHLTDLNNHFYDFSIETTKDNGFFIAARKYQDNQDTQDNLFIIRLKATGDTLWTKELDYSYKGKSLVKTIDGFFSVLVEDINNNYYQNIIITFDENGQVIWNKSLGKFNHNSEYTYQYLSSLNVCQDGGFILAGIGTGNYGREGLLIKTNAEGEYARNTISGKVYTDRNNNCKYDNGDNPLENQFIKMNPGNLNSKTDKEGNYIFMTDTGTYQISYTPSSKLLSPSCPTTPQRTIYLKTAYHDSTGVDFGTKANDCHLLTVNIGSSRRRRCFKSYTDIYYWNEGTTAASGAKIYIKYPKYIVPLKISVPWTFDVKDSVYIISLGEMSAGAKGLITLTDSVICGNESIRNLTQCIKVWITPIDNCHIVDLKWDKSDITVNARCINGQYSSFTIKNSGMNNMSDSSEYRLYYNNSLAVKKKFKLQAGKIIEVKAPANGQTVRLEADQRPGHPGNSKPSAFEEACGVNSQGTFSTGFVNAFPNDDLAPDVAISCAPIVDSYDPNDKQVFPTGIEANHYVKPGTSLEFLIRFQNMGSDTAYNVRVIDTLMNQLDISTLKVTGSSHPYRFDITGQGKPVLIFTFSNINLPHKSANDLGSNGHIKFEVKPLSTIPLNTKVINYADIYFDYNSPVRTNAAWVTIANVTSTNTQLLKNICSQSNAYLSSFYEVCTGDVPFVLTGGIPAGGTYSGNGVSDGKFYPKTAGEGIHNITYTYTAANSCSSSSSKTITVNTCTGTEKDLFAQQFLIYPSPAKEKLMITSKRSLAKQVKVEVFSTVGIKCAEANFNGTETSFDVSNYPKGIYILRISEGNNSLIRKFMKE